MLAQLPAVRFDWRQAKSSQQAAEAALWSIAISSGGSRSSHAFLSCLRSLVPSSLAMNRQTALQTSSVGAPLCFLSSALAYRGAQGTSARCR
jgi:hypothetical protein